MEEDHSRSGMFSKPFQTIVTSIKGKEGMYHLRGHIVFDGEDLPFRGVAFGRFGGHNISVEFLKNTVQRLKQKGLTEQEIQNFEVAAQVKILQGEMTVKQKEENRR
ncbi:MAG: hypothetical protein FJ358_07625 [Thaumarchaeota archaeon]|nr:hypothetical protein [Nitrososphaerota archaeon]